MSQNSFKIRKHIVPFFLFVGVLSIIFQNHARAVNHDQSTKINVVTTIKPVSSIVIAITKNIANLHQLIPDFSSPHDYSFKPSDLRKIKNADVIFRIDEDMETTLNPALTSRKSSSTLISLADNPDIHLLPSGDKVLKKSTTGHQHEHGNVDLHIWSSPKNAIVMASNIAKTMIQIDPENKSAYQSNLDKFVQSVQLTSADITKNLIAVKDSQYLVFHQSWQYFSDYFNLQHAITLNSSHNATFGVKTIRKIRQQQLASRKVKCLFSNPSTRQSQIDTLTENLSIKTATLNSLQSGMTLNQNTYNKWLMQMGTNVKSCLEP